VTLSKTKKITIACVAMMAFVAAQAPPAAPAKKFKDDKEQTLAVAAGAEKDPKAKLEKLDMWKAAYPQTEYEVERIGAYFDTYGQLKMYHEQIQADEELRKTLADNLQLLRTIFADVPLIKPPAPDDLAAMVDAANYIINNPDKVFDPKNKPQGQSDAEWNNLKPAMIEYSKTQLDWVAQQKGKDAVIGRLKEDPTRVQLNVWLGKSILEEAKKGHPEMQAEAIFHYARAAAYTGPGCLPDKDRTGMKSFVDRAYKTYHGSVEGEDKLLAFAAGNALPGDYHIKSNVEMAEEKNKADEANRSANPMLAQWRDVKALLTADTGQAKFDADIKDSALPKFSGKIISMTPALKPKTIVIAVEKDGVADCTLTFEAALPGKMEPGETLTFEGIAKSFTKEPYMLTMEVEKDKLEGWTGKNAPGAARPQTKKKTTP
jgi:hypothetical protein